MGEKLVIDDFLEGVEEEEEEEEDACSEVRVRR